MLEKLESKLEKLELFDENFGLSINQILRKIASQLGADSYGGEIKIIKNGRDYRLFIYHGERGYRVGAPPFFEIKTTIPYSHPFFGVNKLDSMDWIAEHILCKTDFKIGDAEFDAKFKIRVADNNWGNEFFTNSSIRQALSGILLHGLDLVRSEDGDLKAIKYLTVSDTCPSIEIIENAIEQLDQIISNFPENYTRTKTPIQKTYNYWKPLVDLVIIFLIMGAIVYWYLTKYVLS